MCSETVIFLLNYRNKRSFQRYSKVSKCAFANNRTSSCLTQCRSHWTRMCRSKERKTETERRICSWCPEGCRCAVPSSLLPSFKHRWDGWLKMETTKEEVKAQPAGEQRVKHREWLNESNHDSKNKWMKKKGAWGESGAEGCWYRWMLAAENHPTDLQVGAAAEMPRPTKWCTPASPHT